MKKFGVIAFTITGKSATLNGRDYFPPTLYIADKGDTMQYPMYKKPILNDDPNADGYMNLRLTRAYLVIHSYSGR